MSKTKSMQRSLALIKDFNWHYWRTEHWNGFTRRREDMFGFCDILCLDGGRTIAVQACGSDYQEHVRKIRGNEFVRPWLKGKGNELQIWSWRTYLKKRGGKAREWRVVVADVLIVKGEIYIEARGRL